MVPRAALQARAAEWGLAQEVVEKDYVLGWLLWGIGSDPALRDHWIFKGGTCLKKCFVETYRFSEDLDFTVLEGGPLQPDALVPVRTRTWTPPTVHGCRMVSAPIRCDARSQASSTRSARTRGS